jgi:hypothetical protein
MREAEVSVGEHTDINAEKKTISIVEKPYFGFKPKDWLDVHLRGGGLQVGAHPQSDARRGPQPHGA